MKTLVSKTMHNTHTFEVVEEFPAGYVVWNIGRHNFGFEGFLPLAKPVAGRFDFQRLIDPKTLKAIKVVNEDMALKIMKLSHYSDIDKKEFDKIIK